VKMSDLKSMWRPRLVVGEAPGEMPSHYPADGCIIVAIASPGTLVSRHMIRNSGSDWQLHVFSPPHCFTSDLSARFNTHRSKLGAAV
jgi:hypothetical protein